MHPVEIAKSLNFTLFSQCPFTRRLRLIVRYSGMRVYIYHIVTVRHRRIFESVWNFSVLLWRVRERRSLGNLDNRALITRYLRSFRSPIVCSIFHHRFHSPHASPELLCPNNPLHHPSNLQSHLRPHVIPHVAEDSIFRPQLMPTDQK
ncbi:hypothetical protein L210DRAFT_2804780 [Boletus edulis BED1]|uniref:Uncharacterized protein n=1 Tax=Boletus edulis BED1 TaxID=1328754 RepID=A0AAD4C351_BOLED|nr:hypothetical protein L210DRAFT_2804780 [Boletus edulis BED1]